MSEINELFESPQHHAEQPIGRAAGGEVDAIRARWERVTSGPWSACTANSGACSCGLVWDASGMAGVARVYQDTTHDGGDAVWSDEAYQAHWQAITASPTDIATLLDEIDRLTALLDDPTTEPPYAVQQAAQDREVQP